MSEVDTLPSNDSPSIKESKGFFWWKSKKTSNSNPQQTSRTASAGVDKDVNTDTHDNRWKRIVNQVYVEDNIDNFTGRSFLDRTAAIRKALFVDFANVRGVGVDQYRTKNLDSNVQAYVRFGKIDRYMSQLGSFIDSVTQEITNLPDTQQQAAAVRLASVIFGLGIPIHPYVDGNGQTLKMTLLSYLHQFRADTLGGKQAFLPYRLWNGLTGDTPEPENLRVDLKQIQDQSSTEGELTEKELARVSLYRRLKRVEARRSPKLLEKAFPDKNERKKIEAFLKKDRETATDERSNVEGYIAYLLSSQGSEFLSNFVMHDDERDIDSPNMKGYEAVSLPILRGLVTHISASLETNDNHEEELFYLLGTRPPYKEKPE